MDEDILRVQAIVSRVILHADHAELVLFTELDDDVMTIAGSVGRECAVAVQLAPATAA